MTQQQTYFKGPFRTVNRFLTFGFLVGTVWMSGNQAGYAFELDNVNSMGGHMSQTFTDSFGLTSVMGTTGANFGSGSSLGTGINMGSGLNTGSGTNMGSGINTNSGVNAGSGTNNGTGVNLGGGILGDVNNAIVNPSPNGNSQVSNGVGVAINGNTDGSLVNNTQNNLSTGSNTNYNQIVNPNTSNSNGGNAVLMLPRNPLPLGNAGLGRSNFGLQFGLQNNPILSGLGRGGGNALGWFMQAGLTIPFGKIPDIYRNQASQPSLDTDVRQARQEQQRNLFNPGGPNNSMQPGSIKTNVNGRIMSMGAYNYATIPNTKIPLPDNLSGAVSDLKLQSPKIVALTSAEVYSKPLNVGEKIGTVEVGNEYAYLGHTKSGWVKLLMPNGKEGWTSTTFEYLKNDYTEIDDLALSVPSVKREKTAFKPEQKHPAQKRAQ